IEILAELKPDRGDELDRVVLAVERLSPEELEHSERSPIREDGAGEPDLEPGASRGFGAETIAFLGARKTQGAGGCPRTSYDSLSELDEARSRLVREIAEIRSLFAVELRAAQHAPVRVHDPESSDAPFEPGHDGLEHLADDDARLIRERQSLIDREPDRSLPLRALLLGDIAIDGGGADDLAFRVANWRNADRDVDRSTVLRAPARLVMVEGLAAGDPLEIREELIAAIGRNDRVAERAADRFARGESEELLGALVPVRHDAVEAEADDGVLGRGDDRREPGEIELRLALSGDVPEDEHDAEDVAVPVANRRGAVVDRSFGPVPRDEDRVVREPDDPPGLEDAPHGVVRRVSALLADDRENFLEGPSESLIGAPAGERLGDGVEKLHAARRIRDDHSVADARERHLEALALAAQAHLEPPPLADLGVELADLSTEEREGRVRGVLGRHDADQDLLGRTDARAVRDRRPENAALRLRALWRTQDERSRRGVRAA